MIASLRVLHNECRKARLLDFGFAKELFVYPRLGLGGGQRQIYRANCYLALDSDKIDKKKPEEIKNSFENFLTDSGLYRNIGLSWGLLSNKALFCKLVVSEGVRRREEESLVYALRNRCGLDEKSIKLVYLYRDPAQGCCVETVYFEGFPDSLNYDRLVGRLGQIGEGTYRIIKPENKQELMIDCGKELEELDGPYTVRESINRKMEERKRLTHDELNAGVFTKESEKEKFDEVCAAERTKNMGVDRVRFHTPRDMLVRVSKRNYDLLGEILSSPIVEDWGEKEDLERIRSEFGKHIEEAEKG